MEQLDIPSLPQALDNLPTLVHVAHKLAGPDSLTQEEAALVAACRASVAQELLARVSAAIRDGTDPLGTAFCAIKPRVARRAEGQTFTPLEAVIGMLKWAEQRGPLARIIDPGAGSGRYVLTALRHHPRAVGVAAEQDPLLALLLRANARVLGVDQRLRIHVGDYRTLTLAPIDGRSLFIGNPPYVRHHGIAQQWKAWYSDRLRDLGYSSSKLAGLHVHFFLQTLDLARPGDIGCFITSAEWLDVNYGRALREMLTNGLGGESVFVVDPAISVFGDAMTTACITCFEPGARNAVLRFKSIAKRSELLDLTGGHCATKDTAKQQKRWSILVRNGAAERRANFVPLRTMFKVSRGQVTGHNKVWISDGNQFGLDPRFLVPSITRASEIIHAPNARIESLDALRRVVDLPQSLDAVPAFERKAIEEFLKWARSQGADQGYIARHRRPWWRLNMGRTPPVVMTYMGRRPPVFAINAAGARLINVAHGLYPSAAMSEQALMRLVDWLNANVQEASGRVYAGGLTKFEPGEVEDLLVPRRLLLESER